MAKPYDLSKPLVALDHESTLVCVIEMSGSSWLVASTVPGVSRRPLQKLPVDPERLLVQLERWRTEAARAGRVISRTEKKRVRVNKKWHPALRRPAHQLGCRF
jgi:transposase